MLETFAPTLAAAQDRITAVRPAAHARTRNALDGAVTGLSPYIAHGFVTLTEVLSGVTARHRLDMQHKFVFELGWRAYFRHVWQHRGDGILRSLHERLLPDGANWLHGHLLDGDLASNHLSRQWVAGTGSRKPYLFNADNVARYAPASWHSRGSVIDRSYEALDRLARQPQRELDAPPGSPSPVEPGLGTEPHLAPWLPRRAECKAAPAMFPPVEGRCDSFSQWWARTSRGLHSAADLLAVNEVPAW